MTEDLNMIGDDYNIALFTFFITYILFEVCQRSQMLQAPINLEGKHMIVKIMQDYTTLLRRSTLDRHSFQPPH